MDTFQCILATTALDETIMIWCITIYKIYRIRILSLDRVHNCLFWSKDRQLLITSDTKYIVYIWDQNLRNIIWKNKYHTHQIVDILLPNKTSILFTASLDSSIVAYDLSNNAIKYKLSNHKRALVSMVYKHDFNNLITASSEHVIRVSDGIVGKLLGLLRGHSLPVIAMIGIHNSPVVVSLDSGNIFKMWDLRKLECIQSLQLRYPIIQQVLSLVSLQPNHKLIAVKNYVCFSMFHLYFYISQ